MTSTATARGTATQDGRPLRHDSKAFQLAKIIVLPQSLTQMLQNQGLMDGATTLQGGQQSSVSGTKKRGILLVLAHKGMSPNVDCAVVKVIAVQTGRTISLYILLTICCL